MNFIKKTLTISTIVASAVLLQSQALAVGPAGNTQVGQACTHSGGTLNLRAGAGQNFQKVASIPHGTDLAVLDSVSAKDGFTWYKVRFGKKVGFVRSDYVCGL